jgi:hypothetical protein
MFKGPWKIFQPGKIRNLQQFSLNTPFKWRLGLGSIWTQAHDATCSSPRCQHNSSPPLVFPPSLPPQPSLHATGATATNTCSHLRKSDAASRWPWTSPSTRPCTTRCRRWLQHWRRGARGRAGRAAPGRGRRGSTRRGGAPSRNRRVGATIPLPSRAHIANPMPVVCPDLQPRHRLLTPPCQDPLSQEATVMGGSHLRPRSAHPSSLKHQVHQQQSNSALSSIIT